MTNSELITYLIVAIVAIIGGILKSSIKKHNVNSSIDQAKSPSIKVTKSEKRVPKVSSPTIGDNTETVISKESIHVTTHQNNAINEDVKEIRNNFNIRKAIIYKEILDPKYKEY